MNESGQGQPPSYRSRLVGFVNPGTYLAVTPWALSCNVPTRNEVKWIWPLWRDGSKSAPLVVAGDRAVRARRGHQERGGIDLVLGLSLVIDEAHSGKRRVPGPERDRLRYSRLVDLLHRHARGPAPPGFPAPPWPNH